MEPPVHRDGVCLLQPSSFPDSNRWWKRNTKLTILPDHKTSWIINSSILEKEKCNIPTETEQFYTPLIKKYLDYTGLNRIWGFQEDGAPRFNDNRHTKVVRLSVLRTGCLYPPRKYSWYSFLLEAESSSQHSEAGRIVSMKNSYDTIGSRFVAQCLNKQYHRVPPIQQ